MPSRATSKRFVAALHAVASAETLTDCAAAIDYQAAVLFPRLRPTLTLAPTPSPTNDAATRTAVPLLARGRLVGHLHTSRAPHRPAQRRALITFAEHAALALDNLLTLAERDARARRDPLTGLLNHREFHEALDAQLAHGAAHPEHAFSLILFDLDRFKRVNDLGGHAAGDRTLRAAASAIAAACRASDAAFRIGGDELAIVLPGAGRDAASAVASRAATAVQRTAHADGVSLGAATWPADGATRDELLAHADRALSASKGRNTTNNAPQTAARTRLAVAARLATKLAPLDDPAAVAQAAVDELHSAFGFFLAVIQRLDAADTTLRVVAAAGPLADHDDFLAYEQPITEGVNGRVARTGQPAVIADTNLDPDYLRRDPRTDPGSELSLPIVTAGRIWGVMNLEQLATHAFSDDDLLLADAVAAQVGAALHRCELITELESAFATTLGVLADALETKDPYTAFHADEVAELAVDAGRRLGLPEGELRPLRYCALLHDIGKIGIRTDILNKPGRLTPAEFEEMKEHSAIGAALLARIPMLASVAPLVRGVHERYDGAGYPDRLAADAIPLPARIVAVCDALHAMTSDRPYRAAQPLDAALVELRRCAGTQFDPRVVEAVAAAQAASGAGGSADCSAPPAAARRRARRSSRMSSSAGTSAISTPTSDHM